VNFPFNIYAVSFVLPFLATFATSPLWIRFCVRLGLLDDPGHRKLHGRAIPLAGGLAVFSGFLFSSILGFAYLKFAEGSKTALASQSGVLAYGAGRRGFELLAVVIGAFGMLLLGFLDDKYELRPGWKFTGQILVAFLAAWAGVRITIFVPSLLFSYAITVLWIVTVTNAFNFMDNMNGLCAGLGAIGAWVFGWSAAAKGQYLVAIIAFQMAGALTGFLPYNYPNAKTFLGDAGSHLTGYWLAVLAILPHYYSRATPNAWAVLSPLFILAIPLGDMAYVVVLRTLKRQPFYIGDTNHFSHRLVRAGWSRAGAVALIWALGALTGGIALWLFG